MNRWSNNYYAQQAGRDDPRPPHSLTSSPPASRSRRGSLVKAGGHGAVNLLVFRVAHLTQLTLRSFIERQGVRVLDIEQASHKGTAYRSFVVTVAERDAPTLLNKGFWPGLVACRRLQDGEPRRSDVFSRRHAREAVTPATKTDETSLRLGRRSSRAGGALLDKPRSVQLVAARPNGIRNTYEKGGRGKKEANSNHLNRDEGKNDRGLTNTQTEEVQVSKKNSLAIKGSKNATLKVGMSAKVPTKTAIVKKKRKISDENIPGKQEITKTTTIKVKRKISDENKLKRQAPNEVEKGRAQAPTSKTIRTRKSSFINLPNIRKNRKQKSESVTDSKNSNTVGISDLEVISEGRVRPQKPNFSPLRVPTVNRKHKSSFSHTESTENSKDNFSKPRETQSNWFRPLQTLLRVSSEEAVGRLLGPDFDRLMIQENISDEELFLGVRVLAHCARADVRSNTQQSLVYRICQPQVITLIKEFTRTVEEKYKERAESYFWHLGEFLDLYVVHNIFLQGMISLFTACLSKILALSYRKYVSEDLVKVYRGMHSRVFTNLP